MKGIVLAGGRATRLYPATECISKQLLPVFDKPMVYYPLSILMLMGISEILVISTPEESERFAKLLGGGSRWGIAISYAVQERAEGIAQALLIAKDFLGGEGCCLILGDNIFYGQSLAPFLQRCVAENRGATLFAYRVSRPERYGVVLFDKEMRATKIVEKPEKPLSRYAVTGLYIYDSDAVAIASTLTPSKRGELEISDLNQRYLECGKADVVRLGRGVAWLDAGTFEALLEASHFIETMQKRQGVKIACLEEIAYRMGRVPLSLLEERGKELSNNSYGRYLLELAAEER